MGASRAQRSGRGLAPFAGSGAFGDQPRRSQGRAANGVLHCSRQHAPPPACPLAARRAGGARRARTRTSCRTSACESLRSWVRGARSGDGADQRGIATQGEAQQRCAVHHYRSRRRRSDVGTPGADVCDSHCWGTTCPSAPTASRQTARQCLQWRFVIINPKAYQSQTQISSTPQRHTFQHLVVVVAIVQSQGS